MRSSPAERRAPDLVHTHPSETIADAVAALEGADALLVQEDSKPVGVVTRQDLLTYLAGNV